MLSLLKYTNMDLIKSVFEETTYIFNISIEDNGSLYQIANIKNNDNIFIKTLGGCNIFNLLLYKPNIIVSYDDNIFHNFLLELKIACIKILAYEDYFDIFANMNREKFDKYYDFIIANMQTNEAKQYIINNKNIFDHYLYSGKQTIQHIIKLIFEILQDKYPEFKVDLDNAYHNNNPLNPELIKKIIDNDMNTIITNINKAINISKYFLKDEDLIVVNQIDEQFIKDRIMSINNNNDIINKNNIIFAYLYGNFKSPRLPSYLQSIDNYNLVKSQLHKIYIFDSDIYESLKSSNSYNINKYLLIDDVFDYYNTDRIINIIKSNNINKTKYIFWKDKLEHNEYHPSIIMKHKLIINSKNYFQKKLITDKFPYNKYINVASVI